MIAAIIAAIFTVVMLLTAVLIYPMVSRRITVRSRVHRLMAQEETRPDLFQTPPRWQAFLAELGSKIRLRSSDLFKYRKLISTGGFGTDKVNVFMGGKLFLAGLLPTLYLLFYVIPRGKFEATSLLIAFCMAASGYLLPTLWLDYRVKQRKLEIFHTLPDVLDLLTVCVESGQSLDAALIKTVENHHNQRNPLIEEIDRVILEIRAGRARIDALDGLAERTQVDEVRSFVNMLHQTEKFGTSLGKALRIYSTSQRVKRRQFAEAQAAKTGTKMLVPLALFIFPGLLVVILVPAVINIMAIFK